MRQIIDFLEYFLVFYVIMDCNSIYQKIIDGNYRINLITIFIFFILLIISLAKKPVPIKKFRNSIFLVIGLIIYNFIFMIFQVDSNSRTEYMMSFFIIFSMFLYYFSIDKNNVKSILIKFNNIMCVLAILSLIMYLLISLNIIKPSGSVNIFWGRERTIESYYNIQFKAQTEEIGGNKIIRNTGIFTEGPMFNLCLCIALAIELFLKEKMSKKRIALFIVTIITTFASTGILVTVAMFFFKILEQQKKMNVKLKFVFIPAISIIIIVALVQTVMSEAQTLSYSARLDDYIAGFKSWLDSPIMGNGYRDTDNIEKYISVFRKGWVAQSNSISTLLSEGGLYWCVLFFTPVVLSILYTKRIKNKKILFFIGIMLILTATTIFHYRFLMMMFLAIGYSFIINQERKEISDGKI